jgi:Subtilase family/Domain of unknown function (DUF4114)/Bacterial pre-peptidase C-terminal domain
MSTFDVGNIFGTQNHSGIVDSASPFHLYNFNLSSSGSFQVSLGGLSNNADVQLLGSSGNILYSSSNSGTTPEQIIVENLAAGAYAIRVDQVDGLTNYNLSLSWSKTAKQETTKTQIDPITGLAITSDDLNVENQEKIAVTTTGSKIESDSLTGGTTAGVIADSQPIDNFTNPSVSASTTPTGISPESQDTKPETTATDTLESSDSSTDKQAISAGAQANANASNNPTTTANPVEVTAENNNSTETTAIASSNNSTSPQVTNLNNPQNPSFNFGKFLVDATGVVGIDYLFDGGWFEGQLGIFSLTGMEQLIPHSDAFITEAARRAASNSQLGYVAINDVTEGARFSGGFPFDSNLNKGSYLGVKTFNMRPGDTFAIILIPNGATMQQVADKSVTGNDVHPLFSLPIANPNGSFATGQIADVTGEGNTFVMEDIGQDKPYSDKDFNDIIFQVRGATGSAVSIDSVINPQKEWRTSNMGQALIEYAKAYITPADPIVETPAEAIAPNPTKPDTSNTTTSPSGAVTTETTAIAPNPTKPNIPVVTVETPPIAIAPEVTLPDIPVVTVETPPIAIAPEITKPDTFVEIPQEAIAPEITKPIIPALVETPTIAIAPEVTKPDIPVVTVETPAIAHAPVVTKPDIPVVTVETPPIAIAPEISKPDLPVVTVETPAIAAPEIVKPDIPVVVETPTIAIAPEIIKPDVPIVTVETPTIAIAPEISKPDLPVVTVETPAIAAPEITKPDIPVAVETPTIAIAPDVTKPDVPVVTVETPVEAIAPDTTKPNVPVANTTTVPSTEAAPPVQTSVTQPIASTPVVSVVNSDQWVQSLIEFVDAAKASKQPNAFINLGFNLTQTNPDGTVTTRYELTAAERAALAYAQRHNVIIVASAGDNPGQMSALGKASLEYDNIITVGAAQRVNNSVALSKAFGLANYSGSGAGLDILAEGGTADKPITVTNGEVTGKAFGTSVATAAVTGAISQVWAANPKLNYTQVIDILKRTATDLGQPNWDMQTGAGLLNITAAVNLAKITTPELYTVKPGQQTITDNFISQNNPSKQLPGDPTHPAAVPPGIPRSSVDQGANNLSGTRIRISATEDVIDQVSAIDRTDVYRGATRELAGAKFRVLTGQAIVSILSPSGQLLSRQLLSRGTHNLQMLPNAPAEVLLKIDSTGTDATYVLQGFEAERSEAFDINLEFESPLTASQRQIMQAAAKSVASLIGKGLPSAVVDGKIIDDINIKISATNLDGVSGTQARTKIDFMRYGTLLPAQAITQFDAADIANLERSGQLFSVAQHEFLHALGFGNLWEAKGLVDYAGTPLAQYNGKQGVNAFKELGGLTDFISLETEGKGSAGFHWNEALFQNEVMTAGLGFKTGADGRVFSPISGVTIASLADLGYEVNLNQATPDFGLFGAAPFNPNNLTPEQIEAFQQLALASAANQAGEFIPAIMPQVDPNKVAPEIWAHAERGPDGEYYDWQNYVVRIPGDGFSMVAQRTMGNGSEANWKWIANHNGVYEAPYWIYLGDTIQIPVHHPNYEQEQEAERQRREQELRDQQEREARERQEAEDRLKNDQAEQERLRQDEERRRQEAEARQRELEEQQRRLREELERRRQREEWEREQARLAELRRQAEIARQQGKGGLDWYLAKPLPEFGPVDPFETSLTGETVGNLVPDDYYRFTLSRGGRITAELRKLLADADLVLYDVRNEPIAYSMREGITDEQIIADLIPGTYLLRVNSPKGVTTDYELIVKFQHLLSRTQTQPLPPGWRPGGGGNGGNGGGGGSIPPGATFADPRIEKIFKQAIADFAAPERQKARSKVDALRAERDRLEREKKDLIASKSAELRGKVHGMLDRVKSDQQGNVNSIANNIKGGIDGVANGAIGAINGLVPDWVFNTPFVGGWLRDRFNEAKGPIEGAINGARNWLKAKVDEVRNTINDAISWFIDRVKDAYFTAGEANIAIEGIADQFRGMIENATAALNGLIGTFKGMVLGQIEWTRNIGVPGWNLYDNAIVGLVNNLTNGAQDAVRNTGRFFMDRVGDAEKGVQWVIAEIGNLLGDETGRIYNQYQDRIRSLNNQIEAITNETDRRIRAKEAEYQNQIQNFLNQLGDEGKKILDTILNFANSPAGQIGMAVLEVVLGMIPGVGQALDIKDTAVALYNIFVQGQRDVWEFIGLIGALAGWVPGVGDAIKSVAKIAKNGVDALATFLGKLGPDVTKTAIKAIDSTNWGSILKNLISDIGKKWDNFSRSADNAADWIIDALGLKPAWATANNAMFAFRNGADDVAEELNPTQRRFREAMEEAAEKAGKKAAKAIVNSSVSNKLLTNADKLELQKSIEIAKGKNPFFQAEGIYIAEGNGFANFVKSKLPLEYQFEFKHNPDSLSRSADAFAFIEKQGKEGASLIEIMRSGKPFDTLVSPKFSQAESYGNAIGNFLVIGQPVEMKYIFHEAPTATQQANLMAAIKTGIEEAIDRRFDYLVKEGVDPSTLTKEVSINIQIEVWN